MKTINKINMNTIFFIRLVVAFNNITSSFFSSVRFLETSFVFFHENNNNSKNKLINNILNTNIKRI